MAMLQHANSRRMYSWWWDSHISPKNSRWLQENLTDMDKNVKAMIKLIEEDADSFRKRAEMYYRKRPELMKLVEEFYRAYRALAERYDHATGALRQAQRTMAEAFPDQIPILLPDESLSGSSGIDSEPQTSEMLPMNDADTSKGLRQMNAMFATGEEASPAVFTEASQLSEENQSLKNQMKSESERADKAQADVDRLKGTISELESDKETVFVQCQLSQEQISGLEAELSRTQEELKKLNDEMLSSISNLKNVEEQCHLLEEGNQRLKNQITSESERADKAQADAESLKGTISELESVKEAAFLQCQLSQERISSLEDELSCTQQDMKKLNDEMLSNITNLKSVEEQCCLLEEQNNSLQLELNICKERAKTKQAELDTRQEEVEKLEVSIAYEKQRSVQLEMARLALEDLQSQSQEEVKILTLEVQNGAEMLKNTELTKAALEEELQLLKEENAGVEKEKLYLSLKITDLQDEINSLNEAKRRLEDQVQHHVEENGSLKEENFSSSLKIKNLQDEIALLKESKKRLEDDVQLLVEEKNALQLEIISMKEDKALLELRHRELTEKIGSVNLNVESLQALVKELRDGNLELKEMCKMNEDEKSVHLDNLKRMEKIAEKNDVLEASLSNANVELEGLREKIKALEECCETLQDKISMHISDKAIMVSQIETIAQDMEMLSEKNTSLENSLSDANVELEGMRGKLGSLKETCQSLQDNESNLLSEKSTLVTQVESISRSLENSENTYAELECKNMNLEKEKEHMLRQVTELQASLKMEKEEHETLLQSNKSQLATLEHHICILQEKGCLREEALEAECDKLINCHLENFILQRCLHDMTEKSLILSDKYEKNLQTSRCKENFILELEKVSFKQNKSLSALSQDNEKLLEGVNRVMEMLNINNNETPSYQHFELVLNEIKDLQASISDAQDDKQHLMVEKSIIFAFLEQSKLDMMNLELKKDGVEREFRVKCEELSVLLCQKQEQMEINEHLRRDVQGCNQREEGLTAEMALVSQKLADLHEAHSSLQGEISKLLDGKETLEEENNVLLQELITLECLCLTFRSYNAERAVNMQLLGNDLEKEIRSMNVKLGILEIENINLKESVADLEDSKRRLVILEDDVSTSRSVCKELNTQVETEKKLIVQKDMELLQATHNFQVLQDKNSELCRKLEQLMVEIDDAKVVREEFEKKIWTLSEDKVEKDNEIAFLRQANGTMCGDLDQLHNEVRDLKNRQNHLISELQEGIDGAKSCEAELTTLLNESQITTINASVYEEKMLELLLTCESLEISTMVQKEKFYEQVTLRNVFEDELNKKLEALIGENRGLKEELDLYMPLVLSLYDDVASLEECIISPAMHHSLEKQDNRLVCLQHEKNDGEKNADYRTMPAGILELQKLHAKLNALQMVLMDHLEHERSVSGGANSQVAMRKFDELNSGTIIGQAKSEVNKGSVLRSKTKEEFGNLQNGDIEKAKESYDQIVKDIQLDHVLSSAQYKDGASSRAPSTIESVETKYELELWDAGDSNKPVASFHDLEYHQIELVEETKNEYPSSKLSFDKLELPNIITRSDQEWSGSVSGRLSFDGQRLLILQMNVKELKRKMETSLLNESPRNVEFEKIKAQLKEREKAISHLMNKNNKLTKKAEGFSASPGSLASEHNDGFGNISERRSERKISERARRASEKIARLELELQKIQYILLKLMEEEDFRRARIAERKTKVLLKDYLYGRKDSPRRKKVHCCACSRPKTKD